MNSKRGSVLVTGANGLLGKSVVDLLRLHDLTVYGVVRERPVTLHHNIEYLPVDLADPTFVTCLPKRIDAVVHLAQSTRYRDFPGGAADVFDVNVASTAALLRYAANCGATKFVFASSGGVYRGDVGPFRENQPLRTPSELGFYLATKASGEALVGGYADIFDVVILRPFFIYGLRQKSDMLIARLIARIKAQEPVFIGRDNGLIFNPIHCSDAAKAVIAALNFRGSSTFNIAGKEIVSIREICDRIGLVLGIPVRYEFREESSLRLIGSTDEMEANLHIPERRISDFLEELRSDQSARG
jgi:UDP-glucose 4-epimerase